MSYHEDIERRAAARVGSTLGGKYHLDKLLGLGGMAAVYAATHKNRSRVALKMLHAELAMNAHVRERFLREGYVANTVDHPGALRIIDDAVLDDGSVYLVMELLEGETLEAKLERGGGRLPPSEVANIAIELLDVLAAAHEKKIVHRDVKPDNTFITKAGAVKILDFGIARLREDGSTSQTQDGQAVGTPAFMAPEQALGDTERVGPHTDVWAVGATMFVALTGRYVHEGKTVAAMLVAAASNRAPSLASVDPSVPRALSDVVDRALQFDPLDRFADAATMRDALRAAIGRGPMVSEPRLSVDVDRGSIRSERAVGQTALRATAVSNDALPPRTQIESGLSSAKRTERPRALFAAIGVASLLSMGAAVFFLSHRGRVTPVPVTASSLHSAEAARVQEPLVLPSFTPTPVAPSATPAASSVSISSPPVTKPTGRKRPPPSTSTTTTTTASTASPPIDPLDHQ